MQDPVLVPGLRQPAQPGGPLAQFQPRAAAAGHDLRQALGRFDCVPLGPAATGHRSGRRGAAGSAASPAPARAGRNAAAVAPPHASAGKARTDRPTGGGRRCRRDGRAAAIRSVGSPSATSVLAVAGLTRRAPGGRQHRPAQGQQAHPRNAAVICGRGSVGRRRRLGSFVPECAAALPAQPQRHQCRHAQCRSHRRQRMAPGPYRLAHALARAHRCPGADVPRARSGDARPAGCVRPGRARPTQGATGC